MSIIIMYTYTTYLFIYFFTSCNKHKFLYILKVYKLTWAIKHAPVNREQNLIAIGDDESETE